YFRSALHEIAHWCVAGDARRQLEDYGYWYAPDGRNAEQQTQFASVEVLPQAYEALFCAACGHDFRVSLDNLKGDGGDERGFAIRVYERAEALLAEGLSERVQRWCNALGQHYQSGPFPCLAVFIIPFISRFKAEARGRCRRSAASF
ncbi:MAG: elongation factor P hydroxylase, partial [Pseudomonadales bacterium]|nr:elongation factor P hydroxylase [Pseudomonadales bacterium]